MPAIELATLTRETGFEQHQFTEYEVDLLGRLGKAIDEKGDWAFDDYKWIEKAFPVLLRSLGNIPPRDSGEAKWTHSVEVAIIVMKNGGTASDTASALLHDVVEDSELPKGVKVTLEDIEKDFGPRMRDRIDGVTKLKSSFVRNNKPETADLTRHTFFDFFSHFDDPGIILLKLADRLHNMRTIHGIKDFEKRRQKARECMDVYVLLAEHLGLHDMARELAEISLGVLLGDDSGEILKRFDVSDHDRIKEIARMDSEICQVMLFWDKDRETIGGSSGQLVSLSDMYHSVGGNMEQFVHAPMVYKRSVVLPYDQEMSVNGYDGLYAARVHRGMQMIAYAERLCTKGLITEGAFQHFRSLVYDNQFDAPLYVTYQEMQFRYQFDLPEQKAFFDASIRDYNDERSRLHDVAVEKIHRLAIAFQTIKRRKGIYDSVADFKECLRKGIIVIRDRSNVEYGIPFGSTGYDASVWIKESWARYATGLILVRLGFRGEDANLTLPLKHEDEVEFSYDMNRSHFRNLQALDKSTSTRAQRYFSRQIAKTLRMDSDQIEKEELARKVRERGKKIIESAFLFLYHEHGKPDEPLYVSVDRVKRLYTEADFRPIGTIVFKKARVQQLNTFLLHVGLGNIPLDAGRQSMLWSVAKGLFEIQQSAIEMRLMLRDAKGSLKLITGPLRRAGINILHLETGRSDPLDRYKHIEVLIEKMTDEEFERYLKIVKSLDTRGDASGFTIVKRKE